MASGKANHHETPAKQIIIGNQKTNYHATLAKQIIIGNQKTNYHETLAKQIVIENKKKQFSGKTEKANHHSTPPAQQILMKHPKELTIYTHLTLTNAIPMLEFIAKPNGLYPICLIYGGISTS